MLYANFLLIHITISNKFHLILIQINNKNAIFSSTFSTFDICLYYKSNNRKFVHSSYSFENTLSQKF
jgi:hypothetical protein